MGKINSTSQYPLEGNISEKDYLIGTDGDTSNKRTKNFSIPELVQYIAKQTNTIPSDGSWIYSCSGDEYEYGDFSTPDVCFTGNDDPFVADLTSILISKNTIENIPAARYLNLASVGGAMILLINKKDINNYFLIKDPSIDESELSGDTTRMSISFTESYYSKSFKQGEAYNVRFFLTSDYTPGLYKEKNLSSTNDPTTPPDGGVNVGKNNALKVYEDKVEVAHNVFMLTGDVFINDESDDKPSDPDVIRAFKLLGINSDGRIYPLYFGDVQPDWTDESSTSRYYIKNKYPQKDINTNYTLQPSDNGHTIFANTGSGGDIVISVDDTLTGMSVFRECNIIQLGGGTVKVIQAHGGPQYLFAKVSGNYVGGALLEAKLIRQVSVEDEVTTYGNFYLLNAQSNTNIDWTEEEA